MTGLRAKQKEERQRRILEAARLQVRTSNYRDVTIEAIADAADLSAMTVYNYYGSKGGLLLSLVAESDRHLITKIDKILAQEFSNAMSAISMYSTTIFDHAFSYLDRRTWAHVLAISILEGNSTFGQGFAALEQELIDRLARLLNQLKDRKIVDLCCDTSVAATVIYHMHNARFIEFSSDSRISRDKIDSLLLQDIEFVTKNLTLDFEGCQVD